MSGSARNTAIDFHNRATQIVARDPQMAYRLLCSAVTIDPTMAAGWFLLGSSLADLKMLPGAIAALRRCLECPEGDAAGDLTTELKAKALVNLSHRLLNDGRVDEAFGVSVEALNFVSARPEIDGPAQAFGFTNLSLVLSIQNETQAALEYAKEAFSKSQEPIIEVGLAFAHLFAGDFAQGLRHFEARIPYKLPHLLEMPYPRWDGWFCGTLLVAADQGIGDNLSFARFVVAASARAHRVVLQVQPEILGLMTDALAKIGNIDVTPVSTTLPPADAWCPIVSLPVALGMTTEEIRTCGQGWSVPVSPAPAPSWKDPNAQLHIGIAYAGSPLNEIDRWRSVPVAQFLELYRVPGVQLYSLQVGERVADLHAVGAAALIRDMSPWIKDASDTVAIMRELDLVISIESFVGHLAGAMGMECWVPLSRNGGDWRCGRAGDRPIWYPKTRLFRQGEAAAWGPVFDRIVEALRQRVATIDMQVAAE